MSGMHGGFKSMGRKRRMCISASDAGARACLGVSLSLKQGISNVSSSSSPAKTAGVAGVSGDLWILL